MPKPISLTVESKKRLAAIKDWEQRAAAIDHEKNRAQQQWEKQDKRLLGLLLSLVPKDFPKEATRMFFSEKWLKALLEGSSSETVIFWGHHSPTYHVKSADDSVSEHDSLTYGELRRLGWRGCEDVEWDFVGLKKVWEPYLNVTIDHVESRRIVSAKFTLK